MQLLARAVLDATPRDTSFNFIISGHRSYQPRIGAQSSGHSVRPYYPPGPTRADWAWKPDVPTRIALQSGQSKCAPPAFDTYLAGLSADERERVLANKHAYESGYSLRLQQLQRVFDEQMEGWADDGFDRQGNIGLRPGMIATAK